MINNHAACLWNETNLPKVFVRELRGLEATALLAWAHFGLECVTATPATIGHIVFCKKLTILDKNRRNILFSKIAL